MDPWNPIMADGADKNPKHAAGSAKQPFHFMPWGMIAGMGRVMKGGAGKYGEFNWGEAGVVASVYFDAFQRHVLAWWTGEDYDPDDGEHHLDHAACCLAIVRDCMALGNLKDDRPIGKTATVGHKADDDVTRMCVVIDDHIYRTYKEAEESGAKPGDIMWVCSQCKCLLPCACNK